MAHNDEVKLHFLDYWRVVRVRWGLISLAFFLVLITAAIVTYFQPREYKASAFIEVKSTAENPRIFGNDLHQPVHDPELAPTVFQVIQRTGILYPVIDDLKLQDKWGKDLGRPSREQTYKLLLRRLDVEEVRNTDLLQISVFDANPQEAADIANKIVAVYQDKRVEEEREIMNRGVATMNEQVAREQKAVNDAAAEVERIRDQEHIIDLNPEGKEDTETAVNSIVLKQLEEQMASIRSALEKNLKSAQSMREQMDKRLTEINSRQLATKTLSANYVRAKNAYIKERLLLDGIRMRAQTQTMELAMPRIAVSVKQVAEPPNFPARPRVVLNLALGALVGLMIGLGLAFFIEYLDTSVKTMEDVENLLGLPVLAIIPKNIKLLHREAGDTPDAEAYRILRTNIEFNRKNPEANTISLVSGGPGEGKSTTIANLAFVCAQGGYSTLIVDADLRRPIQHEFFGVSNTAGLTSYLTTEMPLEKVILPTAVENLSILPSGVLPADAVGILNSQRMSDTIAELKSRYDLIFFDSPPMLGVSDASVLASEVDETIIVVQHRRFPRAMLTRVKQAILSVGGTLLGVVLNDVDLKHDQNYYYYTHYYAYYQPRGKETRRGRSRKAAATVAHNGASGSDEDEY